MQDGADLDTLRPMGKSGPRSHMLDYNALVDKSLVGMAPAAPPASTTLLAAQEIKSVAKIPTLPVHNPSIADRRGCSSR